MGIVVVLNEEYGYRYYIWHTGMSEQKLIDWWRDHQDKFSCNFIHNLPGKLINLNCEDTAYIFSLVGNRCHIHETDDSYLILREKPVR